MKVFLDDVREPEAGWQVARTYEQVVSLIDTNTITELSLDHHLGQEAASREINGEIVLDYIEKKLLTDKAFLLPKISVHTGNWEARPRMKKRILFFEKLAQIPFEERYYCNS